MAGRGELICLAPALLGPVPATLADAVGSAGPFAALESLLGRASRRASPRADGETLLCSLADPAPSPGGLLAEAFDIQTAGICYRAAPTHLRPDRDRLLLFAGDALRPQDDEAARICDDFNRSFAEDGLSLQSRDGEWLLLADTAPGPDLPALSAVAGRYLDTVIPDDAAARPWRRLLNEVQMFLHDHPVNAARQARGELPVNGLWFWGGGRRAQVQWSLPLAHLHGDDPLARGLAHAGGMAAPGTGPPSARALSGDGAAVAVWTDAERALLGGDAEAWLAALQRFEAEWAGIIRERVRDAGQSVELRTGNGQVHRITPADRWRFWRRPRPLRAWLAIE